MRQFMVIFPTVQFGNQHVLGGFNGLCQPLLDFDVFNALHLMENVDFLQKLKFGDGDLQHYIYNWRFPSMQPKEVGLVLQ